ncbi:hypothetical protein H0X10_04340 [Candidatus Saccharibacteria bacterium]|nr:hypothetical protein [Candidatus Saccharibacteria bacterium]
MNNEQNIELPKYRKAVDYGMITVGLLLFVFLGARAVKQIGDRKIAAGQNKQGTSIVSASTPSFQPVGLQAPLVPTAKEQEEKTVDNTQQLDKSKPTNDPKPKTDDNDRPNAINRANLGVSDIKVNL